MNISAIILSNTIDKKRYDLACETIRTLTESTDWYGDIYVIETQDEKHMIDNNYTYECEQVKVIHPNKEFNYNQFLNIGIKASRKTADWFLLCNNDIEFTEDWLVNTEIAHKTFPDISSFSFTRSHENPQKNTLVYGYVPIRHVRGWCILINKECIDKCSLFDERFPMYYQDNDLSFTLHENKMKHALLNGAVVDHMEFQSESIARSDNWLIIGCTPTKIMLEKYPGYIPNEEHINGFHLQVTPDYWTIHADYNYNEPHFSGYRKHNLPAEDIIITYP